MQKRTLLSLAALSCLSAAAFAAPAAHPANSTKGAAPAAEPAIKLSDFGPNEVMTAPNATPDSQYRGVVKIDVSDMSPNYSTPWQTGGYNSGTGTGFLLKNGLFMTNAHVVSDAERIYISIYGDSRRIPAKVKYIAHDADLALLEVEDFSPFKKITPFELADALPHLEDEVRVIGYPIGGDRLSVTRGVVSRIDFTPYSHPGNTQHITVQVDAAINPGNSGGPALMGSKVIGVAFQGLNNANNTGYVIPAPVIHRFLDDVKDGKYDGYVSFGSQYVAIDNPATRKALGLPNDEKGVLITQVNKGDSADGKLEPGDVLLKINNFDVDSSGMIELDGQNLRMNELVERCFKGDVLHMTILRKGVRKTVDVTLAPSRTRDLLAIEYDQMPRYVVYGGLVFQPVQRNVLAANKVNAENIAPALRDYQERGGCLAKEDLVMLTRVLDDESNARLPEGVAPNIVESVNGTAVKGLSHLYELLYGKLKDNKSPYVVIQLKGVKRPLVFERKGIEQANERIARTYNIHENFRLSATRLKQTDTPQLKNLFSNPSNR